MGAKSPDASIAPGFLRHLVISLKGEDSKQKLIYMKINLKEGGNPLASAVGMISGKKGSQGNAEHWLSNKHEREEV